MESEHFVILFDNDGGSECHLSEGQSSSAERQDELLVGTVFSGRIRNKIESVMAKNHAPDELKSLLPHLSIPISELEVDSPLVNSELQRNKIVTVADFLLARCSRQIPLMKPSSELSLRTSLYKWGIHPDDFRYVFSDLDRYHFDLVQKPREWTAISVVDFMNKLPNDVGRQRTALKEIINPLTRSLPRRAGWFKARDRDCIAVHPVIENELLVHGSSLDSLDGCVERLIKNSG